MEKHLSARQVAEILGVTVKTVQRWDREGRLKPVGRTPGNRRFYLLEDILAFRNTPDSQTPRKTVVYARVSSQAQRPDLLNQKRTLEEFCTTKGIANPQYVLEIGGGLNFKRPKFLTLMDEIGLRLVERVVIAHKDRLVRFGFEWFERYMKINNCEILILNQESLSPEQEMVQDLMTIVHCFSSRLYGLRNYRKKLDEALKHDLEKAQPCN